MNTARHIAWAGLAATAWIGCGAAHAQTTTPGGSDGTPFGTVVPNVATVSYSVGTNPSISVLTNEAVFVVEPQNTPATIEFFRYAPTANFAVPTPINGADFSPSGDVRGPFVALGPATNPGGQVIDTSVPVPLIPAETFLAGEVMFIRVTDTGANRDSTVIDTVAVTIEADTGDLITVQLYETGPDTGVFYTYYNTTRDATAPDDDTFSTPANTRISAQYRDLLDQTDVVIDTALVDPLNRVFSSLTGDLIDGAEITLIDPTTNQPVTTFGVDGFSSFPATQTSGEDVTDSAGLTYELNEGEFRFPDAPAGSYQILVDPPDGFTFSSILDPDTIRANADGTFVIVDASFGTQFTTDARGALRFDIPLDPETDLVVNKTADVTTADVGDFVSYTVTVENRGISTAPLRVHDTLPIGFRYVPGTSRLDTVPIDDPVVADNATALTFDAGLIQPGERIEMRYALLVGPGAPLGDAVNRALIINGAGESISNIARAEVTLREDLLRSTSTIVGRISQNSCDGDADWAREIVRGDGVEGVRLYTETGAYAVSDPDGLYHFEGVTEGTHVVQVDLETLPEGFEIMTCEENTQYAGRNFSKFVDVQGGGIWRANFYLKQTGIIEETVVEDVFSDRTEYKKYDEAWLEKQDATPEWVYPDVRHTASDPSINLGIKHSPDQTVKLLVNGVSASGLNLAGRERNIGNSVMLTRWRGVDILEGGNDVTVQVINADGTIASTFTKQVAYVRNIARAAAVPDLSDLTADGVSVPRLAVRLEDEAGRPVHAGRVVSVDVESPYLLRDENRGLRLEGQNDQLVNPLAARQTLEVSTDGVLHVPLEPTLKTGKATIIVTLDNGRKVPLYYYLEPEKRDWIVVGLAEGTVGFDTIRDKAVDLNDKDTDTFSDGRVAFFAKGLIKGEWLLTLKVDTDQRRSGLGNRDAGFREEIDPNAYYTLYGDRSYQEFEGVSRYPIYVKLEKRQGYALFGGFDTDITEGKLSAYNRRLSGLKAEYIGEDIQVMGFGAETNQGFSKDEIAADGTSGTYRLSNSRILAQSEQIIVETRDRVRPDIILDRRIMVRYLDYTLDYFTGELIFRLPVNATDVNFNPNVIVADYETSEDTEQNLTFGGRAQVELADDRVRLGVTGVQEDGSALRAGAKSNLVGVDALVQVSDRTEIRAEYAVSENKTTGEDADAILAEIVHTSEDLQVETYYRREENGFGLNQRNSNTNGVQRYGVRADYKVSESEDEESGRRTQRFIAAAAYQEDNLSNGNSRSNAEVTARQDSDKLDLVGGIRLTRDDLGELGERESIIATGSASYALEKHGANVSISHEQPLGGSDEVSIYPARTTLGLDKTVGNWGVATLRHEILEGAQANSHNTTFGLSTTPWSGGTVTLATDHLTQDAGRRLGATIGLDQQVQLSDKWTVSAGARDRRVLDSDGDFVEVAPDAAISPFEVNEDFTSAYFGAAYRTPEMNISSRLEGRSSGAGDTYIATAAIARELSEELSLAGAVRGFISEPEGSSRGASQTDARLGMAWRPRDEDIILFNRTDMTDRKTVDGADTTKFVNNFAANAQVSDRWQLTGNWGLKHVKTDASGSDLTSWSHLLGAETRFDITEWLDIGARGQIMKVSGSDSLAYSYGPNIGVSPVDNVWISAGYNVEGYTDNDFEAAEYSRQGPYIQIRFKFDQESARGLLQRISPRSQIEGIESVR